MQRAGVTTLFAEPSGIVIPFELGNSIAAAGRDARVERGPIVTLLDARSPDEPFGEYMAHITRQQLEQSDLAVLTGVDAAPSEAADGLERQVRELVPDRDVYRVDLLSGAGVSELLAAVLTDNREQGGARAG